MAAAMPAVPARATATLCAGSQATAPYHDEQGLAGGVPCLSGASEADAPVATLSKLTLPQRSSTLL